MPAASDIKRRIKSIQNTRKVTRAMQLVSAAKLRKFQARLIDAEKYNESLIGILNKIPATYNHLFFNTFPEATQQLVVIVASNKGLVGNFNLNLWKLCSKLNTLTTSYVVIGKKGGGYVLRSGQSLLSVFEKPERDVSVKDIYALTRFLIEEFKTQKFRSVDVAYMYPQSMLYQEPKLQQFLPLSRDVKSTLADTVKLEPSVIDVVNDVLPRILESKLYSVLLAELVAENAARMLMMQNATDAAGDIMFDLELTYNQFRQAKITTELSEIISGTLAITS